MLAAPSPRSRRSRVIRRACTKSRARQGNLIRQDQCTVGITSGAGEQKRSIVPNSGLLGRHVLRIHGPKVGQACRTVALGPNYLHLLEWRSNQSKVDKSPCEFPAPREFTGNSSETRTGAIEYTNGFSQFPASFGSIFPTN